MKKTPAKARRANGALDPQLVAEAAADYGSEMAIDQFRPLDEAARSRWDQARRKPGRPRRGKGARVISVSVERDLLSRSDLLAKHLGVSRAGLIERGLRAVLAAASRKAPPK
jgi:hypothetical protein